jgi:type IV pilus assembly protein PilB
MLRRGKEPAPAPKPDPWAELESRAASGHANGDGAAQSATPAPEPEDPAAVDREARLDAVVAAASAASIPGATPSTPRAAPRSAVVDLREPDGRRGRRSLLGGRRPDAADSAPPQGNTPAFLSGQPSIPGGDLLGALLVAEELISPEQLDKALADQPTSGMRLGELLVRTGVIDERQLAAALGGQFGIEVGDLSRQAPDPQLAGRLSEDVARQYLAVPLREVDGVIDVVVGNPQPGMASNIEQVLGSPVQLLVVPPTAARQALDRAYRALADVDRMVKAFTATETPRGVAISAREEAIAADSPVAKVVTMLVTEALRDRASDIHLEPTDGTLRVRFRIDGALHDVLNLPITMAGALVSRIKILANMNIVERRKAQDGQFATEVDGRGIDIRVSTMATVFGEKCVMRVLDKSRSLYKLGDLGMTPDTQANYIKMVRSPFGMVLCAGPTGSGKTTTLYATLNKIDERSRNVVTIEDPVEYVFPSINQIQTNEQAGITFADGLRAILRQDPDVILVGEIRDIDTARIAVQAALTGHFVLSSLHATDSVAALHRFLDMGIEAFLVASSVLGIVSQRLVRRICQACAAPYEPSPEEMAFY